MKKLKDLWSRLPQLSRKWRIVRNLVLSAAMAAGIAALLDWPCFSPYGAFRRAERALLLTPSRLVCQVEGTEDPGFLSEGDSWIVLGSAERVKSAPVNFTEYHGMVSQVVPKEGLVVVLLPAKNEQNGAVAAVWGAPEEAVSGTLELDLAGIEDPFHMRTVPELETFTAQAARREDGWFIFQFAPHDNHGERQGCAMDFLLWDGVMFNPVGERPYRLTLTSAQGEAVAQQSGTTPPDQQLWPYWR